MSKNNIVLRIDPEVSNLFRGLSDERDYRNLKESIKENGVRQKGVVANSPDDCKGIIVCGNQRYSVCQELGIDFPYTLMDFDSKEDLLEVAWDDNMSRRNLNVAQKIKAWHSYANNLKNRSGSNDPKGRTRDIIAQKVGSSPKTVQRALFVFDNGNEEIISSMLIGESSIYGAYGDTKKLLRANALRNACLQYHEMREKERGLKEEIQIPVPKKLAKFWKDYCKEIGVDHLLAAETIMWLYAEGLIDPSDKQLKKAESELDNFLN